VGAVLVRGESKMFMPIAELDCDSESANELLARELAALGDEAVKRHLDSSFCEVVRDELLAALKAEGVALPGELN
jgi:hypothetical protein